MRWGCIRVAYAGGGLHISIGVAFSYVTSKGCGTLYFNANFIKFNHFMISVRTCESGILLINHTAPFDDRKTFAFEMRQLLLCHLDRSVDGFNMHRHAEH